MNNWLVQLHAEGGGYSINDDKGNVVGKFKDADTAISHHVFACQEVASLKDENEVLRAALEKCQHVIVKGIEVRMQDSWPALKGILPRAKAAADEALNYRERKGV